MRRAAHAPLVSDPGRVVDNAKRSDAGWVPGEIDCTAGWIKRRRVVEMALPIITIQWCTDEHRDPDPRR